MESLTPRPLQGERELKRSVLWPYAVSAIAAGIVLLLVFHFSQEPKKQEPVVAEVVEQQPAPEASKVSDYCENSEPSEPVKPKKTYKARKTTEAPQLAQAEPATEEAEMEPEPEYHPTEEPDPYLLAAEIEQEIRSRGDRLRHEIIQIPNKL